MVDLYTHLHCSGIPEDLRRLLMTLAITGKYISATIGAANRKLAGTRNLYGEEQLELDKACDQLFISRLKESALVREFASEEQGQIITMAKPEGKYSVTVDPLDGSSLVDVNLAIGSIIGVHDGDLVIGGPRNLVAAAYLLYGPLTTFVYTVGKGTHEFVLNPEGEFVLAMEHLKMREKGELYSVGGLRSTWVPAHLRLIETLEAEGYKLRYSGCLVADVNQVLLKGGGLFTYPASAKSPNGKLRLLFELEPLAFIVEQAGGAATDGMQRILELKVDKLDARAPIYIGSTYEVTKAKEYLSER